MTNTLTILSDVGDWIIAKFLLWAGGKEWMISQRELDFQIGIGLVPCDYWEHFKCVETPINSGRKPAEEVEKFVS